MLGIKLIENEPERVVLKIGMNNLLFSYNKLVAIRDIKGYILDSKYWNYSKTTTKHVSKFLYMNSNEIKQAIKNEEIRMVMLNED